MKSILTICLICLVLSETITDDKKGPAINPKHADSNIFCQDVKEPTGVSNCVDSLLWNKELSMYADRCCFIRYQQKGKMYARCIGLTEEQYLDIPETIRRYEEGDKILKNHFDKSKLDYDDFENSKIYQLDCASSYLKVLSIVSAFFALLL